MGYAARDSRQSSQSALLGGDNDPIRHITELRDAINALRSHLSISQYSWTTSGQPGDWITADPILEMRIALDQALGSPSPSYTTGLAQNQPILAAHIQELRNRVLAAWNSGSGGIDVRWLVADQLGTPRIILDQSGSFGSVTRHDYLPFGEELTAGGRTWGRGYTNSDVNRQRFTGYERDTEVNLDYAHARYFASGQGRFTGVDPVRGRAVDPQSWNMYAYVGNNPVNLTDPTGMNYFMGSGAADPFIDEFRVDGFDLGPEGTASRIEETESMASWSPNSFLNSEGMMESAGEGDSSGDGQQGDNKPGGGTIKPSDILMFDMLWKNHPGVQNSDVVTLCAQYAGDNCTIRLSVALQRSGMDMSSFTGKTCNPTTGGSAAIHTGQLANWLASPKRLGTPEKYKLGAVGWSSMLGRTGIVYISQFFGTEHPETRYNHIDLWNGSKMGTGATSWLIQGPKEVWFWPIR